MSISVLNWDAERLQAQLQNVDPGFRLEILASVDSSNSELMRRARAGNCPPTLLVAQTQSAGRGRLGRQWHSANAQQAGQSLTFSMGRVLPMRDWSGLSLAVGVCIAQCLEPRTGADKAALIGLKWPNDLWWQERKLAGILIETTAHGPDIYVVVGVGVNIAVPEAPGIAQAVAGLEEFAPDADAAQVMLRLAAPLARTLGEFATEGFAPFKAGFEARDVLRGRQVMGLSRLEEGAAPDWLGQACGVAVDGALLVHTAKGMQRITSSEVKIRPVGQAGSTPVRAS